MKLKKGDKCQSPWGEVTVEYITDNSPYIDVMTESGIRKVLAFDQLTRIPSFSEEMQAVLDIAWDVENRLEDDETVQLKVGQFVKFVRHYLAIKDQLDECIQCFKLNARTHLIFAEETEKVMKGETTI